MCSQRLPTLLNNYSKESHQSMGYSKLLGAEYALRMSRQGAKIDLPFAVKDLEKMSTALHGPFQSVNFEAFLHTGSSMWRDAFVQTALKPFQVTQTLSAEGAWLHPGGKWVEGHAVLIDSFQEEASKAVKLAWLLREGKVDGGCVDQSARELERAALKQFTVHRDILRNPSTGLWHNGRGWVPGELSPGHWSRGHGWLLRGLTEALQYGREAELREGLGMMLEETVDALLRWQRDDGRWNAILHLPDAESPPETSGSAMIAAGMLRAVEMGLLTRSEVEQRALLCANSLFDSCFNEKDELLDACRGPGPLLSMQDYLRPHDFPVDEAHGISAMLALAYSLFLHNMQAPVLHS